MTRKERLLTIFSGQTPDRPAVKLWNAIPGQELLHQDYAPVYAAAIRATDLFVGAGSFFLLYAGTNSEKLIETHEQPTESPDWVEVVTTFHTPAGNLQSIHTRSTCNKPGYEKQYLIKEPGDIRKLLSLPYDPAPITTDNYLEQERMIGDAGVVLFHLDHAMYGLQRLIGSENFGLWHYECPDLLLEAITVLAERIRNHARGVLEAGLHPIFGWVGPELCTPPLMSPASFERYVFDIDKPMMDLIHNAKGRIWVHCHGRMKGLLRRFVEMGVDVLNPVEPPPMGDVDLPEAFEIVSHRMGLEGNIETHDLMTATTAQLREKIHAALRAGAGRRFILCPSSAYMEDPYPTPRFINNLLLYIEEGVRFAQTCAINPIA